MLKPIGIVLGSFNDLKRMEKGLKRLEALEVPFEITIASAHRTPERLVEWLDGAPARGVKVIIAGAGAAAHLPGVVASKTLLPVIGLPFDASPIKGLDALYAIVQMPPGIPVATVGIDSPENAVILALQILGIADESISEKVRAYRDGWQEMIADHNTKLYEAYPDARPEIFAASSEVTTDPKSSAMRIPINWSGDRRRVQISFQEADERRRSQRRAKAGEKMSHSLRKSKRVSDHYRRLDADAPDVEIIEQAVRMLREGGIVALPTDTVYGLAVDATNPEAVARLYALKDRAKDKPIPVLIDSNRLFKRLIPELPEGVEDLLNEHWPGPLTLVARKFPEALPAVSPDETLGVRMPDSIISLGVINMLEEPIAATSANLSGGASASSGEEVVEIFGDRVDLVLDCGALRGENEVSTVLSVLDTPFSILRQGILKRETLKNGLKDLLK